MNKRRTRKQKIKHQRKAAIDLIKRLAIQGQNNLKMRCAIYGHDFRENVFIKGDCVCICCGIDK